MKRSGMHIVAVLIGLLIVAGLAAAAPRVKITVLAESPVEMTLQARADAPGCAFAWRLDGAGELRGNLNSATVLYVFPTDDSAQARQAALTVTATDKAGQTASANKTIALPATVTPTPKPTPKPTATPAPSLPKEWKDPVTGMEFVLIPAGEFMMGTPCKICETLPKEPPCQDDPFTEADEAKPCLEEYQRGVSECQTCQKGSEFPAHRVVIKEPFYMGKYEVTQEEWYNVMGNNPAYFKTEKVGGDSRRHPVEYISWNDAQEFLKKLNANPSHSPLNQGGQRGVFRLPSEAEWEYAARAGTSTEYSFGDDPAQLGDYAWYSDNSNSMTHPVGEKLPNPFGLFDMHGNVWEWLADPWHENYDGAPTDGSVWGSLGDEKANRLLRGGSWSATPYNCRSAARNRLDPDFRGGYLGARVVVGAR